MSETQMEQKGHPQSFLPPKPQVPEAGSHATDCWHWWLASPEPAAGYVPHFSSTMQSRSLWIQYLPAITLSLELQDHEVPVKSSLYYIIMGMSILEIHLFHFNPISILLPRVIFLSMQKNSHIFLIFLYPFSCMNVKNNRQATWGILNVEGILKCPGVGASSCVRHPIPR